MINDIDWGRYKIKGDPPFVIVSHICSTRIPYKTAGKENVADRPEIERELRLALQYLSRKLAGYMSKRGQAEAARKRANLYAKYVPMISQFCTELAGKKKEPAYQQMLQELSSALHISETKKDQDDHNGGDNSNDNNNDNNDNDNDGDNSTLNNNNNTTIPNPSDNNIQDDDSTTPQPSDVSEMKAFDDTSNTTSKSNTSNTATIRSSKMSLGKRTTSGVTTSRSSGNRKSKKKVINTKKSTHSNTTKGKVLQ